MTSLNGGELKLAERVAARIGGRWKGVDVDDVTGHLYLWLVENETTVVRWRSEAGGEGKLFVSLRREAAKFCAKEQAARLNRPLTAAAAYPVDVLERAMPFVFEDWPVTQVHVNPVTEEPLADPGESGLALAILADVSGAYYGLPAEQRDVLAWRFRDGLTYDEIGELSGMTKDGAKKRVGRALSRLSDALGTAAS
jgi:DNA-directed RNA polymerase specialized sigma24 family protein